MSDTTKNPRIVTKFTAMPYTKLPKKMQGKDCILIGKNLADIAAILTHILKKNVLVFGLEIAKKGEKYLIMEDKKNPANSMVVGEIVVTDISTELPY